MGLFSSPSSIALDSIDLSSPQLRAARSIFPLPSLENQQIRKEPSLTNTLIAEKTLGYGRLSSPAQEKCLYQLEVGFTDIDIPVPHGAHSLI